MTVSMGNAHNWHLLFYKLAAFQYYYIKKSHQYIVSPLKAHSLKILHAKRRRDELLVLTLVALTDRNTSHVSHPPPPHTHTPGQQKNKATQDVFWLQPWFQTLCVFAPAPPSIHIAILILILWCNSKAGSVELRVRHRAAVESQKVQEGVFSWGFVLGNSLVPSPLSFAWRHVSFTSCAPSVESATHFSFSKLKPE